MATHQRERQVHVNLAHKRVEAQNFKKVKELKHRIKTAKDNIDAGLASAAETRQYIELQSELGTARKETYFQKPPEDFALYKGKRHDTGTALFFRPWKPRDSYHWIETIFNASWSDPNAPSKDGTVTSDPTLIPQAITPYYEALYAEKPIDQEAKQICLDTLRSGNRVLPPTAVK